MQNYQRLWEWQRYQINCHYLRNNHFRQKITQPVFIAKGEQVWDWINNAIWTKNARGRRERGVRELEFRKWKWKDGIKEGVVRRWTPVTQYHVSEALEYSDSSEILLKQEPNYQPTISEARNLLSFWGSHSASPASSSDSASATESGRLLLAGASLLQWIGHACQRQPLLYERPWQRPLICWYPSTSPPDGHDGWQGLWRWPLPHPWLLARLAPAARLPTIPRLTWGPILIPTHSLHNNNFIVSSFLYILYFAWKLFWKYMTEGLHEKGSSIWLMMAESTVCK